jgi:hypothetical protein
VNRKRHWKGGDGTRIETSKRLAISEEISRFPWFFETLKYRERYPDREPSTKYPRGGRNAETGEGEGLREGKTQESQDFETKGDPTPKTQPAEGSNP